MIVTAPGRNDSICSSTSLISGTVSASRVLWARRTTTATSAAGRYCWNWDFWIACDENVDPLLSHLVQQLTVLNTAPAHPLHRRTDLIRWERRTRREGRRLSERERTTQLPV